MLLQIFFASILRFVGIVLVLPSTVLLVILFLGNDQQIVWLFVLWCFLGNVAFLVYPPLFLCEPNNISQTLMASDIMAWILSENTYPSQAAFENSLNIIFNKSWTQTYKTVSH